MCASRLSPCPDCVTARRLWRGRDRSLVRGLILTVGAAPRGPTRARLLPAVRPPPPLPPTRSLFSPQRVPTPTARLLARARFPSRNPARIVLLLVVGVSPPTTTTLSPCVWEKTEKRRGRHTFVVASTPPFEVRRARDQSSQPLSHLRTTSICLCAGKAAGRKQRLLVAGAERRGKELPHTRTSPLPQNHSGLLHPRSPSTP
jgi:hypothetical protein